MVAKHARFGALGPALGVLGLSTCAAPAFAADQPADPDGAKIVANFVAGLAGKAAAPSVSVKPDGAAYLVSFDLGAASAAFRPGGVVYDPATITLRVFRQDDGAWRVETASVPPFSGHMTPPKGGKVDFRIDTQNLKSTTLLDPKLNWIASAQGGADSLTLAEHGPGFDQSVAFAKPKFDARTKTD